MAIFGISNQIIKGQDHFRLDPYDDDTHIHHAHISGSSIEHTHKILSSSSSFYRKKIKRKSLRFYFYFFYLITTNLLLVCVQHIHKQDTHIYVD